jgi:predicted nucleotidyltransferase
MSLPSKLAPDPQPPTLKTVQASFAQDLLRKSAALAELLSAYADKRGRFILFGSVARGEVRHDSDLDLLIDFPPDGEAAAFSYVEEACSTLGIPADLRPFRYCSERFLSRIAAEMKVIQP